MGEGACMAGEHVWQGACMAGPSVAVSPAHMPPTLLKAVTKPQISDDRLRIFRPGLHYGLVFI